MPTIVGKRYPDELAQIDAVARKRRDAESEEAQRTERKLLAEIAAEDKKRAEAVNLPPESPAERRERELEERIANLEHRQIEPGPVSFDVQSESRQHRRREALRLLRNRKDLEEREQRERGDGTLGRRQAWNRKQEGIVAERDDAIQSERDRHEQTNRAIHQRATDALDQLGDQP